MPQLSLCKSRWSKLILQKSNIMYIEQRSEVNKKDVTIKD